MDENGRYPHDLGNLHFSVLESSNQMNQRSQPRTLSNEWRFLRANESRILATKIQKLFRPITKMLWSNYDSSEVTTIYPHIYIPNTGGWSTISIRWKELYNVNQGWPCTMSEFMYTVNMYIYIIYIIYIIYMDKSNLNSSPIWKVRPFVDYPNPRLCRWGWTKPKNGIGIFIGYPSRIQHAVKNRKHTDPTFWSCLLMWVKQFHNASPSHHHK